MFKLNIDLQFSTDTIGTRYQNRIFVTCGFYIKKASEPTYRAQSASAFRGASGWFDSGHEMIAGIYIHTAASVC